MATILGIAGSLRKGSFNRALLAAATELMPAGSSIECTTMEGVPLYDGDVEREHGVPDVVARLKARLVASDGLLVVSPEYNNSVPGTLKNTIDWMSRPPKDIEKVFGDKPVGIIGASTSRGGTRLSQNAWMPVFRTLGMVLFTQKSVYLAGAEASFKDGKLVDEKIRQLLQSYLYAFSRFVDKTRRIF